MSLKDTSKVFNEKKIYFIYIILKLDFLYIMKIKSHINIEKNN